MNEIYDVIPQGCCGGVRAAIAKVLKTRQMYPDEKITVLGNLVHNQFVKEALKLQNIETLEDEKKTRLELLDGIEEGIVIFTAHGVSPAVYEKAEKKHLQIVDASCPFVLSTQKEVAGQLEAGRIVFYIGKFGHPEAESIYTSSSRVILIEKEEDIPKGLQEEIFVTNQTTMSIYDLQELFAAIRRLYPEAVFLDELCNATRVRQQAVLDLQKEQIDTLIVIGDPASNNTRKLESIGKKAGIAQTMRIESAADLENVDPASLGKIALTSGASTPGSIKKQVLSCLKGESAPAAPDLEILLSEL